MFSQILNRGVTIRNWPFLWTAPAAKEKGLQVHPAARAKFLPNFQEQQT
jgi:hypothetical protein